MTKPNHCRPCQVYTTRVSRWALPYSPSVPACQGVTTGTSFGIRALKEGQNLPAQQQQHHIMTRHSTLSRFLWLTAATCPQPLTMHQHPKNDRAAVSHHFHTSNCPLCCLCQRQPLSLTVAACQHCQHRMQVGHQQPQQRLRLTCCLACLVRRHGTLNVLRTGGQCIRARSRHVVIDTGHCCTWQVGCMLRDHLACSTSSSNVAKQSRLKYIMVCVWVTALPMVCSEQDCSGTTRLQLQCRLLCHAVSSLLLLSCAVFMSPRLAG